MRIVLLGGGGVGKSALTLQFLQNKFIQVYDPTIEQTYRKTLVVDGRTENLDIVDTAGQEELAVMRDQHIEDGDGFILVYSITSRASFTEIETLRTAITRVKDRDVVPIVLVGNKCDLEEARVIPKKEAEALASKYGWPFYESSAKDTINVDEVFYAAVRETNRIVFGKVKKKKTCTLI